jgi:ribose 5-phosphate isomerase B
MIALGCDHGGYELMQEVKKHLEERGLEYKDFGCNGPESVDYPVYGKKVAQAIVDGECEKGILICGTGIGVSIVANKVPGAYAALVNNVYQAQRAQLSNNANIITLGAQVTGIELAKCLVKEYLSVTFDPESRSMPKVARITEYEKEGK